MIWRASDERIVTLFAIVDDAITQRRIVAALGYEPSTRLWQVIDTVDGTQTNREEALEQLQLLFAHWVDSHYSVDELVFNEEPEAWVSLERDDVEPVDG